MARPTPARQVASMVFAATVVLQAIGVGLTVASHQPLWPNAYASALTLAFPLVGVLIARRRPRNAVAWLCLTIGLLWGLESAGWGAALYGFSAVPSATWPAAVAVAADAFWPACSSWRPSSCSCSRTAACRRHGGGGSHGWP